VSSGQNARDADERTVVSRRSDFSLNIEPDRAETQRVSSVSRITCCSSTTPIFLKTNHPDIHIRHVSASAAEEHCHRRCGSSDAGSSLRSRSQPSVDARELTPLSSSLRSSSPPPEPTSPEHSSPSFRPPIESCSSTPRSLRSGRSLRCERLPCQVSPV
jgi:hypothetical protein